MVKTRPILMNARSVRGIRDGSKTQTRRLLRPQPEHVEGTMYKWRKWLPFLPQDAHLMVRYCPHGQAGDRLWVKETWAVLPIFDSCKPLDISSYRPILYKAGDNIKGEFSTGQNWFPADFGKWRPSIYMPRWASRIVLEVLRVRVERVQDITEEDALAEGCQKWMEGGRETDSARSDFAQLWNSIHEEPKPRHVTVDGKRVITHYESYPWEDIRETREHRGKPWHVWGNPWVFVIEFRRLESEAS